MFQAVRIGEDKGRESCKGGVDELEDWRPVCSLLAGALAVDAHLKQVAHAF